MNQRLDAETPVYCGDELVIEVEFVTADLEESYFRKEVDAPEDLQSLVAPIVTVNGTWWITVKTSLLII